MNLSRNVLNKPEPAAKVYLFERERTMVKLLGGFAFDIVWLADDAALPEDALHAGRFQPPPTRRLVALS